MTWKILGADFHSPGNRIFIRVVRGTGLGRRQCCRRVLRNPLRKR